MVGFFFQAEDGIRDTSVTGVQTCALPILSQPRNGRPTGASQAGGRRSRALWRRCVPSQSVGVRGRYQIGRASCREGVASAEVNVSVKKQKETMTERKGQGRGAMGPTETAE